MSRTDAAILILGEGSLPTARRIQAVLPGSVVFGLKDRVSSADVIYDSFGEAIRAAFLRDQPVLALCAAGIIIRSLAPLLQNKRAEPPVLAVAEDGSAVVPLLGGLRGVNDLARTIGAALETVPAITTTGEIRLNLTLEHPPQGYVVRNSADGKRFMADLLAGASVSVRGDAPWLARTRLVPVADGQLTLTVTSEDRDPAANELIFHPKTVLLAVDAQALPKGNEPGIRAADSVQGAGDSAASSQPDALSPLAGLEQQVRAGLEQAGRAVQALAGLILPDSLSPLPGLDDLAGQLGVPLRFVPAAADGTDLSAAALIAAAGLEARTCGAGLAVGEAERPDLLDLPGHPRGRLSVVGLGPGCADLMAPAVKAAIQAATDIIGYDPYVKMAGPFRPDQVAHPSDNRVELDRARHAFALAQQGRRVVVVSSGDPGIFAMATAVLEALDSDGAQNPGWHGVTLEILPGITAAQSAAARIGAPLGHDFCIISLSDNLKPWPVVEQRLELAARADLAMAFYNPISKARPWQLGQAFSLLRRFRPAGTLVVLGRDIGRPAERLWVTTLGDVTPEMVDMRTVVLVGSSLTRAIARPDGNCWVYTPRFYPQDGEMNPSAVQV